MLDLEDTLARIVDLNPDERARFDYFLRQLVTHPARRAAVRPCRIVFAHSARPWRGRFRREWWFKVVAPNGRILAHSEGYARRADCLSAACSMRDLGLILDNPPPPGA